MFASRLAPVVFALAAAMTVTACGSIGAGEASAFMGTGSWNRSFTASGPAVQVEIHLTLAKGHASLTVTAPSGTVVLRQTLDAQAGKPADFARSATWTDRPGQWTVVVDIIDSQGTVMVDFAGAS